MYDSLRIESQFFMCYIIEYRMYEQPKTGADISRAKAKATQLLRELHNII